MGKWGRYDGITADFKESDAKPGGPGWFPVIEAEDGELRRKDSNELTWKCDICHEERPDKLISVAKHVHVFPRGFAMQHNVKYCNDRSDCQAKALVRTHFDQGRAELRRTQDQVGFRLAKMHRAPFWAIFGLLVGAAGAASVYELWVIG